MNILHLLSQFEVTGAETFAATLANEQILHGHSVTIVSDTFHTPTTATIISLPLGKRDFLQRIANVRALSAIIAERKIDVVHAHSRAASWIGFYATRTGVVPLISTVHGRQHVHFSSKLYSVYGEKIVAVCESIREHLIDELHINENKISIIRNGIDLQRWNAVQHTSGGRKIIAIVGRLSGPKGIVAQQIIQHVAPSLLKKFPELEVQIVGGEKGSELVLRAIQKVNAEIHSERIFYKGFVHTIEDVYSSSTVVIGSGRVAMEAMVCGASVIAIGESNYVGVVNEENLMSALHTNFGDAGVHAEFNNEQCTRDIIQLIEQGKQTEWGKNVIEKNFNIAQKVSEMYRVYAEARSIKLGIKEIPILMYHRVTGGKPEGTKHGIYVTAKEFDRQLKVLLRKNFTTLTFFDIQKIIEGKLPLPRKPIMLTFDDGYEDNYEYAFPLFKKYNMFGVIFLLGDTTITTNEWDIRKGEPAAKLLSDSHIAEMKEYGIEFGGHSMRHKKLSHIALDEAAQEIVECKKAIEQRIGSPIISFAYPYGAVNEEVKSITQRAGFLFGIATDSGRKNFWSDLFEIRRVFIFPNTSRFAFWKKTSGWYHSYKKVH